MEISTSAFADGDSVPVRFTCEGEDVSPALSWSGVPEGAADLRLSVTDPDAPSGSFTHWLVTGIDTGASGVDEGAVPMGGSEQRNGFGDPRYGGPCPPPGRGAHRYVFSIEALDAAGNVLDSAEFIARFGR